MEALLISGGEFRQSVTELEIDRSFTVVDMRSIRGNSRSHLHHQWRSMTQLQAAWKEELRVNSWFSSPHHQCRQTHIRVSSCQVRELGLVTVSTSSSKYHQCESAWSAVIVTVISLLSLSQLSSSCVQLMRQKVVVRTSPHTTKGACQDSSS